jgi:hypothetical protein
MKRFQVIVTTTTEAVFTIEADATSKNKLRIIALEKLESSDNARTLTWRTLANTWFSTKLCLKLSQSSFDLHLICTDGVAPPS